MASEDASPDPAGLAPPASGGPLADQPSSGSVETGLSVDSSAASANESESTPDDTDTPPIAMPDNTIQQTTSSRQPLSRFSSAASGTGDAVGEKDDPAVAAKKQQIRDACVQGDFWQLQRLAGSDGGFLTDELRQLAWPVLLGIPVDSDGQIDVKAAAAAAGISPDEASSAWEQLPPHRDEEQVQLDVNRAFVHYPTHSSDAEEARQKQALSALIVEILRRYPFLCYFQGFHDICQVFLLVLPPALRTPAVARLAVLRIRDFMLPTIDAAVQQLLLLPDILRLADPPLWNHLRLAQHPRPFFALSGTLTMYAHDVQSLGAIARLFDVLLARPPAFSLYLFAAIARAHRAALFATPADEPEMLHHILSKLPGLAGVGDPHEKPGRGDDADDDDADSLDALIAAAAQLAADYPPHMLPSWRTIPASSVLKTAAPPLPPPAATEKPPTSPPPLPPPLPSPLPLACGQTVADGEHLFHEHVRELERTERRRQQVARVRQMLWQYRGPIRAVGVAVLVGVVAIALRRSGGGGSSSLPASRVSAMLARLGLHVG